MSPIECDEAMDRTYIPLPGGWEIQTQGKGSSFRIANTQGGRRMIVTDKHLHGFLEEMARDIHAAATPPAVQAAPIIGYIRLGDQFHPIGPAYVPTIPQPASPAVQPQSMTVDEFVAIALATKSADSGRDGYILPVTYGRAIEAAVLAKLKGDAA